WIGVSTGSPDDYRAACAQNGKENPHCVSQPAANLHYRTQMLNTSMMSKACCKNPKNLFCFVCGLYILSHHKRSIMTRPLLEAYESYFKVRTTKENYLQGPPSVCNVCNNAMLRWKNGMCPKPELPFAIPMLWSQPADHETDCYFCLTRTAPMAGKRRTHLSHAAGPIEYPILRSAIRPKLFATRPSFASQSLAPVRRQISVPDRGINEQAEGVSSVSIRTYPRQSLKPKESPVVNGVMPVVRRSLPAQKIVSGIVATHPSTAAGTLKRKLEPDVVGTDMTYGMTKVRLRNSEPTIVLEKCKKLLPSNSAAIIRRPMTPNSVNAPRILNVFSLNKDAVNCGKWVTVVDFMIKGPFFFPFFSIKTTGEVLNKCGWH
uniref:Uncharacterized protein n=1 Tax=Anopheles maculatus TaxID=74869 RepID=A0A182S6M1_9DIPT